MNGNISTLSLKSQAGGYQAMKIGVLGAKAIGGTLGGKWVRAGHQVRFGVRHVDNPQVRALVEELGENASVGSVAQAIAFGDVVVFAIPGQAMDETIQSHAGALNGKVVIDVANKMGGGVMNSAATFGAYAPQAAVFRAFNNIGWENFESPVFDGIQADLFYCGNNGMAKTAVEELIRAVGLNPVYVGDLDKVGLVDAITSLWFALAYEQGMGRHLAFKLLRGQ
jgi:predicted dinucleotide-binding enzyme